MKKVGLLIMLVLFLASCQAVTRSEFLEHDSMYKNWDHAMFSWYGHRNPTEGDLQKSVEQQWWGFDVPYVPGQ